MTTEYWLKGGRALITFKDAFIPSLVQHYLLRSIYWNTSDDHLKDLLDQKREHQVQPANHKKKQKGCNWYVSCSKCQPLLKMIEASHRQPARLMWTNNQTGDSCPKTYKLAKLFMSGKNEKSEDYSDLDAVAVLEILRNDTSFWISEKYQIEILNLILFRNNLMHSSSCCISANDLDEAFTIMKNILEDDRLKNLQECIAAVKALDKLQQADVICEVDESNEIWKRAKSIQKQALGDLEQKKPIPEVMSILLTKMEVEYHKEKMQQLESELSESKKQIKYEQSKREHEQSQREHERRQREYEQKQREIEEQRAKMLKCQLDETNYNHQIEMQKSNKEKEGLKSLVEELTTHTPSFIGRVAKGTVTGTGVGVVGGPVGAAIGATAGGVVGGISFLWDKVTK